MILKYIKVFLVLSVLSLSTVFTAQTSNDTNFVYLETKKVDFLVEWYLRAQSLMVDTNIMAMELRGCDAIIEVKDRQISNLGDVSRLKDTIIQKTQKEYLLLGKKLTKSEKKVRVYKNITAISVSIIFILTGLLIIK